MDKLDALKMKPILECPNPFMRVKSSIPAKEYTQLCHIVLELETYMLEQKKLPTDFTSVSTKLMAAMDPAIMFGDRHIPPPPARHDQRFTEEMKISDNDNDATVNNMIAGYDIQGRLDAFERT